MADAGRRQLIVMLAVLIVVAAVVALVVAAPGTAPPSSVRAGAAVGGDDLVPETTAPVTEDTATTVLEEGTTSAPPPAPPPTAPAATAVAPTSPPATPPMTAPVAAGTLPPAALDVGPETCVTMPAPVTGDVVGVAQSDGLHEVSIDGSRDVLLPNTAEGSKTPGGQAWSADGRRLAYMQPSPTRQDANHYPASDIVVVDLVRGCSRVLSTNSGSLNFPAWSPDGTQLAYVRSASSFASAPQALEIARDDGTRVQRVAEGRILPAAWAPDGSGQVAFGQDGGLRVRRRDGKVIVADDTTGGAEFESWSPDATKLIYTVSVHQGIWVAAADGSGYRDLSPKGTTNPNGIFSSRFSPDGRRIAFGRGTEIWVMDADGNNPSQVVGSAGYSGAWWTPAGDELVYATSGGIRVVPAAGGDSRLLHAGTPVTVFRRN